MDFMMGQPKKKPACGGLKSIFLEEDRGDGLNYAGPKEIKPIGFSDIDHTILK
jgi:hypothetical protein